jgi:hypothetical protein
VEEARYRQNIFLMVLIVAMIAILFELTRSDVVLNSKNNNVKLNLPEAGSDSTQNFEKATAGIPKENFLIVYDPINNDSVELEANIQRAIKDLKKESTTVSIDKQLDLKNYRTVILTTGNLKNTSNIDQLTNYVAQGGHVFFSTHPAIDDTLIYNLYRKIGMLDFGRLDNPKGIHFDSNVLIQTKGTEYQGGFFQNQSLHVSLDASCRVLAHTVDKNIPLLWEKDYQKGKFMIYNGDNLYLKLNRGLVTSALALLSEDFIYPVQNTKVVYIDDFPAPFPQGKDLAIFNQYGKDIPHFHREIWWPDMMQLAANNNMIYTGGFIETYNNKVTPPFINDTGDGQGNLITYGRDLIKNGGEIALHGYNHQSLDMDQMKIDVLGYKAWDSITNMELSIREANRFIHSVFPNYQIRTYIPPSNVLSMEGREALRKELPALKTLASVFNKGEAALNYVQEFEMAPDGLLEMPRITSGYFDNDETRFAARSMLTHNGVFSHFLHPDDILDWERSLGYDWKYLLSEMQSFFGGINRDYPWLRRMTSSEAAFQLEQYLVSKIAFEYTEHGVIGYSDGRNNDMYFILRTDKKIGKLDHCTVKRVDEGTYLVQAKGIKFEIGLDR